MNESLHEHSSRFTSGQHLRVFFIMYHLLLARCLLRYLLDRIEKSSIKKGLIAMINDYEATKPMTTDADLTGDRTLSNNDVVSTLNGLIETCKDGQEGFKQAAEGVERSDLKSLFFEFSQQRAHFAGELQSLVQTLGEDPADSGSFAGSLHRGWINIKSLLRQG